MKKGIIINFKRFKLLSYVNLNKVLFILCSIFLIGIILGVVYFKKNNLLVELSERLFNEYLINKNEYFKSFYFSFIKYLFVLILYFISGLSAIGVVLTPFLSLWQGIMYGCFVSYIYSIYGISGIAFNAMLIIPSQVIFLLTCLYAARYSIEFSLCISKLTLPKSRPITLYSKFKDYSFKYLIYILICLFCAVLDIVLYSLFLNLFNI